MRRLLLPALAAVLVLGACSDDDTSSSSSTASPSPSATGDPGPIDTGSTPSTDPAPATDPTAPSGALDTAAVAAAAQAAIDEGDALGPCPFDPAAVAAAVGTAVTLVPEFDGPIEDDGQVYSGGDVDITYCQIRPDEGAVSTSSGIVDMRVDVHPGTADIATYLDEEWGDEPADATESAAGGGTLTVGCFDEFRCIAMWQGEGLFVAILLEATDAVSAAQAGDALMRALPVVSAGLVSGR